MLNLGIYHEGDGYNEAEKITSSLASIISNLEET